MSDLLNVEEVADLLKVHRSTVYRMVEKGELPAFKVGFRWRFVRFEVDLWTKLRSEIYADGPS
jgi:excisionase family DNA binding protein